MTIHSAKEPLPDLEQCEFPIQVEHKGGKVRVYQMQTAVEKCGGCVPIPAAPD